MPSPLLIDSRTPHSAGIGKKVLDPTVILEIAKYKVAISSSDDSRTPHSAGIGEKVLDQAVILKIAIYLIEMGVPNGVSYHPTALGGTRCK